MPVVEVFAIYGRLRLLPKQFLFLSNVELGASTADRFELTGNKAKKTGVSDILGLQIKDGLGNQRLAEQHMPTQAWSMAPVVEVFAFLREVEAPAETILVPLKRGT